MIYDNPIRSLLKAASWRLTGSMTTITIAYFVTGTAEVAFAIGSAEMVGKFLIYFGHERIWNAIPWGRSYKDTPPPKKTTASELVT